MFLPIVAAAVSDDSGNEEVVAVDVGDDSTKFVDGAAVVVGVVVDVGDDSTKVVDGIAVVVWVAVEVTVVFANAKLHS